MATGKEMMTKWVSVDKKLPHNEVLVYVKRDFSLGAGGGMRPSKPEWVSIGFYRCISMQKPHWSIKATEGLTLNNSYPTHWREIK